MAHILVLDSIQQDIFVCGICKIVYNCLQPFLDHKKTCGNEQDKITSISSNLIKPVLCDVPLSFTPSREIMINNEDNMLKDITCKFCKKKFKKVKSLCTHLKTHTDSPYQCPICGRCFIQNSHLQRHILCHKVWPDGLNETTAKNIEADLLCYACSYCNVTSSNYSQFRAHLKIHAALKKFKCIQNECIRFYETVESLLNHVLTSHENPNYTCYVCTESFNSLESIAIHYQNHNHNTNKKVNVIESKLYKCSLCDATFKRPEKLSLHKLTESHKKNCIHCNKTFASDKRLRSHLQIHSKSKPFKCNMCNSSFHMKKYLTSHLLKHGDRQFSCAVCNLTFKRQDLLHRHMRLHQTRKLLKCPFSDTLDCKKEFTRNDKLKSHIKYHTKQVAGSSVVQKSTSGNDGETVEICIVPLDSKNDKNEGI